MFLSNMHNLMKSDRRFCYGCGSKKPEILFVIYVPRSGLFVNDLFCNKHAIARIEYDIGKMPDFHSEAIIFCLQSLTYEMIEVCDLLLQ